MTRVKFFRTSFENIIFFHYFSSRPFFLQVPKLSSTPLLTPDREFVSHTTKWCYTSLFNPEIQNSAAPSICWFVFDPSSTIIISFFGPNFGYIEYALTSSFKCLQISRISSLHSPCFCSIDNDCFVEDQERKAIFTFLMIQTPMALVQMYVGR
uniref:Uncharacterized protein n=1 Tax=Cacopsylla melanoneura TaxID=428564 RepID=A0A8D8X846_9HEMI